MSLAVIGITANIGLTYSLKFLWAPLLDQAPPSGLLRRLGRRRGWLAAIQPALVLAAVLLGLSEPGVAPAASLAAAALVALLSASQDIVIDAWRIEVYAPRRQGAALAMYVWGYRIALLLATTGAIAAANVIGWHLALLGVAALIGAGLVVTLLAPEPQAPPPRPAASGVIGRLRQALVEPLAEFLTRQGAWTIIAFVALFKLGEAMAGIMTAPFYRALGFDRPTIAGTGFFSLGGTLAGITLGGWLVARIGVGRALLWTGWTQTGLWPCTSCSPFRLARFTCSTARLPLRPSRRGWPMPRSSRSCPGSVARQFAATHYALLSSLAAIAVHTLGGLSGLLAAAAGWKLFYALCMLAALPSMGLMMHLLRRYPPVESAA